MVYSFETSAYNTEIGSISNIVKTKYGYHILKINDKRPSVGKVKVSHIMSRYPQGDNKYSDQCLLNQKLMKFIIN